MKKLNIANIIEETYVDGPGLRYSIYISGCEHRCKNCHNKNLWNFNIGFTLDPTVYSIIKKSIISNPLLSGVTISGGDPFHTDHVEQLYELLVFLSKITNNIWVYTGYTIKEILNRNSIKDNLCLSLIDVLVDGQYIEELATDLPYRGSANQTLIKTKEFFLATNFNRDINKYLHKEGNNNENNLLHS